MAILTNSALHYASNIFSVHLRLYHYVPCYGRLEGRGGLFL